MVTGKVSRWKQTGIALALSLLLLMATGLAGSMPASAQGANPRELTFGAATVGGVWYLLAGAWAEAMQQDYGTRVTVIEGGSIANVMGLAQGTFQMALSNGEVIPEAYAGRGSFNQPLTGFSAVAALYPNPMHIVVRRDSDIHTLTDLRGRRVSPGIKGYSGEVILQNLLRLSGVEFSDLGQIVYTGTADAANLIRDGHLDSWGGVLAAPNGTILELATTPGIRLLSVDENILEQMQSMNPGYVPFTIPAGTYPGQDQDVRTVAPFTVLLARDDLSEDFVYQFLRDQLFGSLDRLGDLAPPMRSLTPELAYQAISEPIHPGAMRYYREVGVAR